MPAKRPSSRRTLAVERSSARHLGWARLTRTVVLGALATIAAIIWLGEQYGIERDVILEFVATSALFVGILIIAGLGGTLVLKGLKKLWRR